ncbi:hypothetical protein T484DRAFT_1855720 [Baffinella frigidus]|nr:hypothetical protein T484DRAFT_1855720 [Cryptophyta sp. CCMP2293]
MTDGLGMAPLGIGAPPGGMANVPAPGAATCYRGLSTISRDLAGSRAVQKVATGTGHLAPPAVGEGIRVGE